MKNNQDPSIIDFDVRWKELIHIFTKEFIAFFLPTLYPLVNFKKPPEFLEQELQKLFADEERTGKKISDKLIKLYLKNEQEHFVLFHVEVEGDAPKTYPKEVYKYFYRILDRHENIPVTTLVVYVGDKVPKQHNVYRLGFHGTELTFKFNTYIVKEQQEKDLLALNNVFALAILANLYVLQSKHQYEKRFLLKTKLIDLLLQKKYSTQTIIGLFVFIKYLMRLPEELEEQLSTKTPKVMTFIHKGYRLLIDDLMTEEYGKTAEQILKELEDAMAREEQLLAQQKAKEEQLLAQQKAEKEQLIVNMYQQLHINIETIAQFVNMPISFVQQIIEQAQ